MFELTTVTYTLHLPKVLPPAHRGRAFRFSYDLVVSLAVLLPGQGKRQKSKDIHIPIRIWANVSLSDPAISYDVLKPIIQTKDEAEVNSEEAPLAPAQKIFSAQRRSSAGERVRLGAEDTAESFRGYSRHLLDTLDAGSEMDGMVSPRSVPLSPSKADLGSRLLSPTHCIDGRKSGESMRDGHDSLGVPNGYGRERMRRGSFIKGDDELVVGVEAGSAQAVEVLSRHSTRGMYQQ